MMVDLLLILVEKPQPDVDPFMPNILILRENQGKAQIGGVLTK
jgi:hypothetical protein